MNTDRYNVLNEISTYALKVRELLPKMPDLQFLKKQANRLAFSAQQVKQKRNSRQQIALYFKWLLTEFVNIFLKKYQLQLAKVQLIDSSNNIDQLEIEIQSSIDTTNSELAQEKVQCHLRQYARKEITNLSDAAWQSFINAGTNFASLRFVKECRKCLDMEFEFFPNTMGEYCDPKAKIMYYLKFFKDNLIIINNTINIRLAGDGTNVCRNFTVLNFTVGFLDKYTGCPNDATMDPNTALGNFILGKFHIKKECYEDLRKALKELDEKLSVLKEIVFEGVTYQIEFWLGGDLKFILIMLGMNAANSGHPCPFCILHKSQFSNNICGHKINRNLSDSTYGQIHAPIFKFIKIENVIPDCLHMGMRITDKLENNLKSDIEQLDNTFSENLERNENFESYVDYLEGINIKRPFYVDKSTSQLVLRDLNGGEKKRLFEKIDLPSLFPELENSSTKNGLWKNFFDLMYRMRDDRISIESIKNETKKWLEDFTSLPSVNSGADVTPYMHIFASHLHEQIDHLKKKGLYFNSFSMQGLEFLNCLDIRCFHRSTNKKGEIIKQLIKKRSRTELLSFHKDIKTLFEENRPHVIAADREATQRRIWAGLANLIEEPFNEDDIDDQPYVNSAEAATETD